ncbi:MAG: hypothetical protein FJ298_14265 [Planctomycetes bacterium]|nr:hypothetical protein [Planctomycetota bacterium]
MKTPSPKKRIAEFEERIRNLEDQKRALLDSMQRLRGLSHALNSLMSEADDVTHRAIRDADKVNLPF